MYQSGKYRHISAVADLDGTVPTFFIFIKTNNNPPDSYCASESGIGSIEMYSRSNIIGFGQFI